MWRANVRKMTCNQREGQAEEVEKGRRGLWPPTTACADDRRGGAEKGGYKETEERDRYFEVIRRRGGHSPGRLCIVVRAVCNRRSRLITDKWYSNQIVGGSGCDQNVTCEFGIAHLSYTSCRVNSTNVLYQCYIKSTHRPIVAVHSKIEL